MRVAYQAGAVQALHEEGLRYSYADATSGGTMNLAALLSGVDPSSLTKRWREMDSTKFLSLQPLRAYTRPSKLPALGNRKGVRRRVLPHLGVNIDHLNSATGIHATFNVCGFDDKGVVSLTQHEVELPHLLAAVSLPVLMPSVQYGGRDWTDSVWIKDSNILNAVQKGANEIWVVWCIGNTPCYQSGMMNQYVHMIEISAVGAFNGELKTMAYLNDAINRGERPFSHDRPIAVHLVRPEYPIPLDPDYLVGKVTSDALVNQGFADASHYLRDRQTVVLH